MPAPALAPPPRQFPLPDDGAAPPVRIVRAPLSRPIRLEPTGRITRPALLGSLAAHAVLLALAVWALAAHPLRDHAAAVGDAGRAGASGGGGETVSYLEVGAWPSAGGAAGTAAGAPAGTQGVPQDTTTYAELPALPREVPRGIPAAPAPATRANAGAGVGAGPRIGSQPANGAAGPGAATGLGSGAGAPGAGTGGRGGVLQPGYDPRLVARPVPIPSPPPPSDIERYREHLQARLDEVNNGAEEEAEHQYRLHNWTWKDSKGREWGIGNGGVPIVAGHRLPTAVLPPIPRDRDTEDAQREAARRSAEIAAQADAQERDKHLRERVRAIRARQDSIRKARHDGDKKP